MALRKGWLLLLGLLGACGLPSPDQARKNLAPETPLTPEYRDIPLARIHLGVSDLYPLLFGESENVRLFAVGEGEGQGRIRPGMWLWKSEFPTSPWPFRKRLGAEPSCD